VIEDNHLRHHDEFQCQQCGKCCLEYAYNLQATEEDVCRWEKEGRWDILQWVARIDVGVCLALDFPIHPKRGDDVDRCPFLRKLPRRDIYICRIHDTKPDACRCFPTSREKAESLGCPGWKR
jgi:Fe-S-cluster containining protein